jgi:cytochrome c
MVNRPREKMTQKLVSLVLVGCLCAAAAPAVAQAQAPAAGPEAAGKAVFEADCASCHSLVRASTPSGPSLKGVMWRKIADRPDFRYSAGLRATIGTWTPSRLDAFLKDSQAFAPGTDMYWDVGDPDRRRAIVDYLSTVK